jgi:hypothetical protein
MATKSLLKLAIIILVMISAGCSRKKEESDRKQDLSKPVDSVVIVLEGQTGKSVFEITSEKHHVEFLDSPAGAFVYMIDSLETGSRYGWMYSVNDSMGQVASDRYITDDTDVIKWHYRKY